MRGWVIFALAGILVLLAPEGAQRGGLFDGVEGNNVIAATIFFAIAFVVRPTEERLIGQAGDMTGPWGCGTRILSLLMVVMLILIAVGFISQEVYK